MRLKFLIDILPFIRAIHGVLATITFASSVIYPLSILSFYNSISLPSFLSTLKKFFVFNIFIIILTISFGLMMFTILNGISYYPFLLTFQIKVLAISSGIILSIILFLQLKNLNLLISKEKNIYSKLEIIKPKRNLLLVISLLYSASWGTVLTFAGLVFLNIEL